ncbi:MAG: fibronectin type III domain-containing protein, partial [Chloroflexales bacterium]
MTSSSHPRCCRPFIIIAVNAILFALLASFLGTSHPAYAELPPETYVQGTQPTLTATSSYPAIDDGIATALPIGFPFTFYGTAYTQFALSTNGFISFNTLTDSAVGSTTLPTASTPNNLIAAFWDDLDGTSTNGKIFYATAGTAPNRRLVVQWTNTGFYSQKTPLGTFQIILYEGSNTIQVQYRYLVAQDGRAHGNNATVGIENAAGTAAVLHSYNAVGLTSGQAIRFTPNGATYDRNPTAAYDGIVLGAGATVSPAYPQQLCPANSGTWNTTPTFYWADSGAGVTYRLIVDSSSTFRAPVIDQAGLTATSYTPGTALIDATTYYWSVIASNANDATWSEQWSFTTNAAIGSPPCVPQLVAPSHQATGVSTTPTCSWQATVGVTSYRVVVSPNADLTSPVYDQAGLTGTSQAVSGLAANTSYYWRVSAVNANGATPSTVRSFTTTVSVPPTVTTSAATSVSASDA